jgi:hypothetical protein
MNHCVALFLVAMASRVQQHSPKCAILRASDIASVLEFYSQKHETKRLAIELSNMAALVIFCQFVLCPGPIISLTPG